MTNQLTINFFHRHYTNFDREKLFLEKSSIILLIGSRKIAPKENCPQGKLPSSPNYNANPKPNPDPDRGAIFQTRFWLQIKNKWS